jgi:hypothetical protein
LLIPKFIPLFEDSQGEEFMAYAEFYGRAMGRDESAAIAPDAMVLDATVLDTTILDVTVLDSLLGRGHMDSVRHKHSHRLSGVRSFGIWTFTLLICMVVVGFPMLILVVTVGSLAAVVLQSVLPMSAVLVISGGILGLHLLGVFGVAALLTLRGVYPQDVSWLTWLSGSSDLTSVAIYAACPLTCDVPLAL